MNRFLTSPSQRGVGIMLLSLFFFTANVLLLRGLSLRVPEADGWVGILFRGAIGLGLLVSFFTRRRSLLIRPLFTHPRLVARGLIGAFATLLFYITIVELGASRAIVINLSYPLFGVVIAAVWLKETLTVRAGGWLLAGFGGLLVFFSDAAFVHGFSFYDLVAVVGAATSGIAVVLIRGLSREHHHSTIYASQCVYAILLTLPVAGTAVFSLPLTAWFLLSAGACLVAIGQLSITIAFRDLSVAKGSSIQMLLPFFTATGAFLFLGERLTAIEIVGALLTLLATWQVLRSPAPVAAAAGPVPAATVPSKP